jgi:hypothetical protein
MDEAVRRKEVKGNNLPQEVNEVANGNDNINWNLVIQVT